jgi:glucose-6-phosphate isomerase, archaeal
MERNPNMKSATLARGSSLRFDANSAALEGQVENQRRLSALRGCFVDEAAYAAAVAAGDPVLYATSGVESVQGEGQLHYVIGTLEPGKVGDEYYMTKGHIHAWRPAAEVYIGLRGEGTMLLQDEATGECIALPLAAERVVYVPGHTAHRTINTGSEPLVYWGVLSSAAGHDYGAVAERNFALVVVEVDGQPQVMERTAYLQRLAARK